MRTQSPDDDAPYTCIDGDITKGLLLVCDHADNRVPPPYGSLGLPPDQLERHIAYDIGARAVTEHLAAMVGAPAVLSRFSRLLIDPNRGADDPTLVMKLSDGAVVPGNADAGEDEIAARRAAYYDPYHAAIDAAIDDGLARGRPPAILSIHSFTEAWKGVARPWHVTVLWDKDPRLPRRMLAELAKDSGIVVGENEPYSGELEGDCMYRHGTTRGIAHALIEVRQDLIRDADGQRAWAERLGRAVRSIFADDAAVADLAEVRRFERRAA